ncbi:MAG: rhamnulokinase [Clostridia bacterium]|nr:rhamnulokinase [Clostridia bacterium]
MKYYLAIDIGASSGRHIVGWEEDGEIRTHEVYRFPNGVKKRGGHLVWSTRQLVKQVKAGIEAAREKYGRIESFSVDTWGVDYVLMKGRREAAPCYSYRDHRTEAVHEEVHALVPFSELYRRTGCQFQPFNTVYQLFADKTEGRLDGATDFLMMPEYIMYKLTGVMAHEYTNATTTGLVNAETREYDRGVIKTLGLPEHLFKPLMHPGAVIGGYEGMRAVLCATHDTASAVKGIPMEGNCPYISSGTWSLLGVRIDKPITGEASEEANWSNEGGVGYIRYQKNIMGMWLVNRLREELCPDKTWSEITREAEESRFDETVDANDDAFLSPVSMKRAFDLKLRRILASDGESDLVITNMSPDEIREVNESRPKLAPGDYFRCAYRSLALSYGKAIEELERAVGARYDKLYIVGGGAKNGFLNELTEKATGKRVVALPMEATALGNLKIQMEADR